MINKKIIQILVVIQTLIAFYIIFNTIFDFGGFYQVTRFTMNTVFFIISLIIFVEVIIFLYFLFKEKAVRSILLICAFSSAVMVVLMVTFVASEGIPAFIENDPIEFITGSTFQIFYYIPTENTYDLVTTVEPEHINETTNITHHVVPSYHITHLSQTTAGIETINYQFINPVDENITVTITVESPDFFIPSFNDITWDYETNTGQFSLLKDEIKTYSFVPRMIARVDGVYLINISVLFTDEIRETAVLELRYQSSDMLRIDEFTKTVEPGEVAIYPLIFNGETGLNYTLRIIDIQPGWQYQLKQDDIIIFTQDNPTYEFYPENKTMQFYLYVMPPESAGFGEYDTITISIHEAGTKPTFGILPFIVGTMITSFLAILIAAPIGLGASILLSEYLPRKLRYLLRSLFELLAGIPSVIYGLWGFLTFGPFLANNVWPVVANTLGRFIPFLSASAMMQKASFTAGIVLSIMILPIVITLSEDAIRSVSKHLREGSLALGATRWQTIRKIVLPGAKSGIISGIILGLGRAIGETMAVLMIMGFASKIPSTLLEPSGSMTAVIASQLGGVFDSELSRHALFGIALLLFLMIFVLNIVVFLITKEKKYTQKKRMISFFKGIISKGLIFLLITPMTSKKTFSLITSKTKNKTFSVIKEPTKIKSYKHSSPSKKFVVLNNLDSTQNLTQKNNKSTIKNIQIFKGRISQKNIERIMIVLLSIGVVFALSILVWILGDVLVKGLPSMQWMFFIEREIGTGVEGGFLNAIIGSLQLVGLALLIAAPLAIGAAIYIQEYGKKNNLFTRLILFTSDTLASTPSIVFGGFGFLFFVVYLHFGFSVLAGGFTLAFMILPLLLRSSIEAIKAIPREFYEGSLALGATKWQAIKTVILPPARPGIVSGVILGVGRSIGETAAVMFTAGYSAHIASSILHPAASLPNMIYKNYNLSTRYPVLQDKLYSVSIVLILMVLILNTISKLSYLKSSKMLEK